MKAYVASGVVGVGTGIGSQVGKGGPVEMEAAGGHVFTDPDHGVIAGVFQAVGFKSIEVSKGGFHDFSIGGRTGRKLIRSRSNLRPSQ